MKNTNDIREISMERVVSKGHFPVFKVIFRSNGEAIYEGKYGVDRIGIFLGSIEEEDFSKLSEYINFMNFNSLSEKYMIDGQDQPNIVITVEAIKSTKVVNKYGEAGPVELWAIEKVIDSLAEDIYWEAK